MRLIRLKIKNIASLKGEHEIDFTEIHRGSPLFAITGETGAGKSTILNSIGLALYGEIYKKNINQIDVVTLGEKEGLIELIFQVKNKFYLADWRVRVLKQNGEPYSTPQSPVRNLYTLEGTDFNSLKTITTKNAEELLNLNFDQFCRCIILNQGEFAKFLNSSFKDRRDILEKLYPGEMLDSLSKELENEKKALEKSKHDLEIELHTLRGDNLSGIDLKEQKNELEKKLKKLDQNFQDIEKLDYHFTSLLAYHDKFNDNEYKKNSLKSEMTTETTKYNHLLKTSESISEKYLEARKEEEERLPILQGYLLKEEKLKNIEEKYLALKNRAESLKNNLGKIDQKCKEHELNEKGLKDHIEKTKKGFKFSIKLLKESKHLFTPLFELFTEKELLVEETKSKKEKLDLLETNGKESKAQLEALEKEISSIPVDIKEQAAKLDKEKIMLAKKGEDRQRELIIAEDYTQKIESSKLTIDHLTTSLIETKKLIELTSKEILPFETTLKLQEIISAQEVCVSHALKENSSHCPVCEQPVLSGKWNELKEKLQKTNLEDLRKKYEKGQQLIFKAQNDLEHIDFKLTKEKEEKASKEIELKNILSRTKETLPSLLELELKVDLVKRQSWLLESLLKEIDSKKIDLQKTREAYSKANTEYLEKERILKIKIHELHETGEKLKGLISTISKESLRDLKTDVIQLNTLFELETKWQQLFQEKTYLAEQSKQIKEELDKNLTETLQGSKEIEVLKTEINAVLNGEKASDLISKLSQKSKAASEAWARQVEEQKQQELILKNFQGKLYQLDELSKEYDTHFTKELHTVRELSAPALKDREESLLKKLKFLDLSFSSPRELFIPLRDLIQNEKEYFKNESNSCRMSFASATTKLLDWEKLQDKIQLLELRAKDINENLSRKMRLFEVLGKDELRTFVLSLVEENLIRQTNDELQKLCQGRYEIVHQVKSLKMTPEFFILDKFREGGRRKVSTLSGGETFMVSLAMALGLAEMTRGQAEIDSLFIDEGFGTLDQESLEDVLDMLKQIQTRGLMVGIISHIKTLTNALPVNLLLTKKQDGTSQVSLQYN